MARRKHDFREDDKIRVLLWCARHCCLCGKFSGLGIEVAHLDRTRSDIDSAIPLCFDCHAAIGHYNSRHPRGRRYSVRELRARRDQVYEEQTRHLVAPVTYRLKQDGVRLPTVLFEIQHVGDTYPVRVRVTVRLAQGTRDLGVPATAGHYDGGYLWNLNPRQVVVGNFALPEDVLRHRDEPIRARVDISLRDIYEREHPALPGGYIHSLREGAEWYFEPAEEELGPRQAETN